MVQLSYLFLTTAKAIALTIWTFVSKVMSLLFNILSRFVMVFLPRSKRLLISWLKSLSAVFLDPKKIKPDTNMPLTLSLYCHALHASTSLDYIFFHRHLSNTFTSWFPILFLTVHASSCVCVHSIMSDSLLPMDWGLPGSSVHGIVSGKNA